MKYLVLWLTCGSLLVSNVLLWLSLTRPDLRFWPPPAPGTPTYRLSRLAGVLSPIAVLGTFALGPLDFDSLPVPVGARYVGAVLFSVGGAFALWGYFGLGVRASQGYHEGLVARGAYRFSRNPQYVGTIICVLGHVLMCASALTAVPWALWSFWFLAAPFAEEPWLRERLGPAYDEYAARVPRYLGFPRARESAA